MNKFTAINKLKEVEVKKKISKGEENLENGDLNVDNNEVPATKYVV